MKDAGLIFLWGALILAFAALTAVDARLVSEIEKLNSRLTAVDAR